MTFSAGAKLGSYEILSPSGKGGMGEVYKARDARLDRFVAIKVLPEHVSNNSELKTRFEREAKTLASLSHPHICPVFDIGQQDGIDYLVMEFLEGQTLAERLEKGAIPLDEALQIAIHVADALDKAHRQGVIHRDVKPSNIMLTKSGPKLLDFGLAKLKQADQTATFSALPTRADVTAQGTILGTLQYMAPEQLEGIEADARTDIFAFGSVLYEMVTGKKAFQGKSQASLIGAIMHADPPPVSALQAIAPPLLDDVVKICLAKVPDDRWQTAADLEHELKLLVRYGGLPIAAAKGINRRERVIWAAAVFVVAIVAAYALLGLRDTTDPAKASFEVQTSSPGAGNPFMIAISPDGRNLVAQVTEEGVGKLWVRPIELVTGVTPQGTEGATYPFWSPDGRYIGFFAGDKLKKVDIFGAPPQTLSDAPAGRGGTWNRDGVILFALANGPLFRIAASGGQPVQVSELDRSRNETAHRFPRFLPDGVHFLYLMVSSKPEESGIYVGSLNSKETKRLVASTAKPEFAPPDLLLFLRESTLMAQRFDTSRLELSGDPFQVAEQVGSNPGTSATGFTVSDNGVLAYRRGAGVGGRRLVWIDRSGKAEGSIGTPALYQNPRLSPDGKRLAVFKPDGDIWVTDLERGNSTRFTFDPATDNNPVWSPDGTRIAFVSNRDGSVFNLYQKGSGGTGEDELLLKTPNNKLIDDWSADGRYILYQEEDPKTKADLWILPLFGDRKPMRLLGTPFNEQYASFSPDGRWIAYESNESGTRQVYVQNFPASGRKWLISTTAIGAHPRWRPDGKELFYDGGGPLMAVDLTGTVPGGEFKSGAPQELFLGLNDIPPHNYDVTPGGRRFLVATNQNLATGPTPIVVVLNWKSGINP